MKITHTPQDHHPHVQPAEVVAYPFADDGQIPNNPSLPLVVYQQALVLPASDPAAICETVFTANRWGSTWRNGIFPYHHYHSTAHEVLGICRGQAEVQFGGEQGKRLLVRPGDVVVIPAGVGHKKLSSSADLLVVGAYPPDQHWDLCRGLPDERPQVLHNIAQVPLPATDPVFGKAGPLVEAWLLG